MSGTPAARQSCSHACHRGLTFLIPFSCTAIVGLSTVCNALSQETARQCVCTVCRGTWKERCCESPSCTQTRAQCVHRTELQAPFILPWCCSPDQIHRVQRTTCLARHQPGRTPPLGLPETCMPSECNLHGRVVNPQGCSCVTQQSRSKQGSPRLLWQESGHPPFQP